MGYTPAERPTFYFIGVTTGQSSIMRVFPAWARHLGLGGAVMRGLDFPLHADPAAYREAVSFIKSDPLSLGALVTTHKIDLFRACSDLFEVIDPFAAKLREISCISKRDGKLVCHAKDPITSRLAIEDFIPQGHFARTGAELFCMGAGGSSSAIVWNLTQAARGADVPSRIVVSDLNPDRLEELSAIHGGGTAATRIAYERAGTPDANDAILGALKPGSFVVNATGLGKDRPGSPLSDTALFPLDGYAWDLNYRGDLVFLRQARAQQAQRRLHIANGWVYFIHGWTQVIAEVFDIEAPTSGPGFEAISRLAADAAKAA